MGVNVPQLSVGVPFSSVGQGSGARAAVGNCDHGRTGRTAKRRRCLAASTRAFCLALRALSCSCNRRSSVPATLPTSGASAPAIAPALRECLDWFEQTLIDKGYMKAPSEYLEKNNLPHC